MTKIHTCKLCEAEHSNASGYCSSGCDLAGKLPMGAGDLPVTWQLGVLLVWLFALFNQLLFTGMKFLSFARGEADTAAKFGVAALVLGSFVLLWNLFLFSSAKSKKAADFVVVGGSVLLGGVLQLGLASMWENSSTIGFLVSNLLIAMWLSRGLLRLKTSKNTEKNE